MRLLTIILLIGLTTGKQSLMYATQENEDGLGIFQEQLPLINQAAKKVIGHNPEIEIINYKDKTNHLALFCHGWGGNKWEARVWTGLGLPIIVFNFADATPRIMLKLHKSNFGQLPDVMTFLYTFNQLKNALKKANELESTHITFIGYSRGGATVVNALNVLHNSHLYRKQLKKCGMTDHDCKELLACIQRGSIVLHCPLTDVPATIKNWSSNISTMVEKVVQSPIAYMRTSLTKVVFKMGNTVWNAHKRNVHSFNAAYLNYVVLPLLTKYHARGEQAISSITKVGNMALKILTIMHKHDKTVCNQAIKTFFKVVFERDSQQSYFFVGQGTHVTPPHLEPVKAFLAKHTGQQLTEDQSYMLTMLQPVNGQSVNEFMANLEK